MRKLFISPSEPSFLFIPAIFKSFDDFILQILRQRLPQHTDCRKDVIVHPWLSEVEVNNRLAQWVEILEHVSGVLFLQDFFREYFYFLNVFQSLLLFFDGICDHYNIIRPFIQKQECPIIINFSLTFWVSGLLLQSFSDRNQALINMVRIWVRLAWKVDCYCIWK